MINQKKIIKEIGNEPPEYFKTVINDNVCKVYSANTGFLIGFLKWNEKNELIVCSKNGIALDCRWCETMQDICIKLARVHILIYFKHDIDSQTLKEEIEKILCITI